MMTQGVMTQISTAGHSKLGTSQTKDYSKTGGFDLMMNQNLESIRNTNSSNQASAVKRDSKEAADTKRTKLDNRNAKVRKNDQGTNPTENIASNNSSDKDIDSVTKDETNIQSKADKREGMKDISDPTQDILIREQLMGMLQAVQEAVMEFLNITQAELDQLLADQGLTLSDLTNTDGLKQLILGANGKTDIMEFVTNGDLAASLHSLTDAVNSVQKDFGLKLSKDEIETALAKLNETETVSEELPAEGIQPLVEEALSEGPGKQKSSITLQEQKAEKGTETSDKPSIEVIKVLDSEEAKEGSLDDNKESSKEAAAGKQFEAFLDNLVANKGEAKVEFTGNMVRVTELREIASQIIERIKVIMKPEQTSMELQLNPEHLGKVQLHIQSKEGSMTAQFVVQNEMTKEAIEGQLQTLKEALDHQGIKVEAIEVTVSSNTFDQGGEMDQKGQEAGTNQSSRGQKITLEEAIVMQDGTEVISPEDTLRSVTGSNIDMTA